MRLVILAALLGAGCPGQLADPARFFVDGGGAVATSGCGDVAARIIQPRCAVSGCHGGAAPQAGLALDGSPAALVGQQAMGGPGRIIDGAMPDASVLYLKVTAMPPFGERMPLGSALDDADVECVRQWVGQVARGAP